VLTLLKPNVARSFPESGYRARSLSSALQWYVTTAPRDHDARETREVPGPQLLVEQQPTHVEGGGGTEREEDSRDRRRESTQSPRVGAEAEHDREYRHYEQATERARVFEQSPTPRIMKRRS
jgi:hypothetical protein